MRLLASWKSLQTPAVHEKKIGPSIMVVVIERESAACRFEQILVVELASVNGFPVRPCLRRDLDKADAERRALNGRLRSGGRRRRSCIVVPLLRPHLRGLPGLRLLRA